MKKFVSIFLAGMMLLTVALTGCGQEQVPEEPEVVQPKTIHVYTCDSDVQKVFEYVWNKNSEWKDRVEFIVLPKEGFAEAVDATVSDKENEKCPDVIIADNSLVSHFTKAEYTDVLSEFTEQELSLMYPYTKEAVTTEEELKGVTWEVNPGAFVYRKSIISEYIGADDAKNVQSFVKDWDTLIDTARAIDKKFTGEIKMLASAEDVDKIFAIDLWPGAAVAEDYQGVSATIEKNKYSAGLKSDADDYYNAANQGTIIGYFCNMNGLNKLEQRCKVASKDDWGVCVGPKEYVTANNWMFVTKKCEDREFVTQMIKALCTDADILRTMFENGNIFVNNTDVIAGLSKAGKGKLDFLGSNDYIKVMSKAASCVTVPEMAEPEPVESEITTEPAEAEQE